LEIFVQLENYQRIVLIRQMLGEVAIELERKGDARHYFEANLDYLTHSGDINGQAYYRARLASLA
jgi:hypothetical protein